VSRSGKLRVEYRPVSALAPYARNARTHPEWQIAQIAASIREFGFANPILVDAEGVIIAGHGRLLAAQRIGLESVPVIELGHLTEEQRRALVIADNKIAENAGWDEEILAAELQALFESGFDLDVLGFADDELDALLAGDLEGDVPAPALGDEDHVPEDEPEAAPVSRPGDLWILGEHRVICGDALDREVVGRLLDGHLADMVWTDPPYNVAYESKAGRIANDDMDDGAFRRFLVSALSVAADHLRAGGPVYVAHADTEGLAFRRAFRDAGLKLSGCLIWVKQSLVLGRSDYQWRHEPILYGWKPGAAHPWYGGRARTTVMERPGAPVQILPDGRVQVEIAGQCLIISGSGLEIEAVEGSVLRHDKPSRSSDHPTMKPVALIAEMLENSSQAGDVVLDPFGGSGSTLIACHKLGRRARLVELEPRFVDVIVRRWEGYSGLEAVDEDGRSFEAVARTRRREAA
jgi:DNA modification methylase